MVEEDNRFEHEDISNNRIGSSFIQVNETRVGEKEEYEEILGQYYQPRPYNSNPPPPPNQFYQQNQFHLPTAFRPRKICP